MWADVFVASSLMVLWCVLVELFPNAKIGLCEWPVVVATVYSAYCLGNFAYLSAFALVAAAAQVLVWLKLATVGWTLVLLGHVLLWLAIYERPFDHLGKVFKNQTTLTLVSSACCVAFLLGGLDGDVLGVFVIMTFASFLIVWALWAKQENGKKFSLFVLGSVTAHVVQTLLRLIPQSLLPARIVGIPPLVWYLLVVFYLGYEAIDVKKVSEQTVV